MEENPYEPSEVPSDAGIDKDEERFHDAGSMSNREQVLYLIAAVLVNGLALAAAFWFSNR